MDVFRVKVGAGAGVADTDAVVVFAADAELAGTLIFILRASSRVLGAELLLLVTGQGSRLMTGLAEVDVGRGAARRLLRVTVEAAG